MNNKKRKTGLFRLIEIAGTKRWWLIGSIALAVVSSLAEFTPLVSVYMILKELAANASNAENISSGLVWHWAIVALVAYGIYMLCSYLSLLLSHIAAFNILYEFRIQLAQKIVRLPMGFFTKRASGEIRKVMAEDVNKVELFVAHHLPDLISASFFPVIILVYMYLVDWRLAIVVSLLLVLAFFFVSQMLSSKKMKDLAQNYNKEFGKMNASIVEYVRGISVIKIFNKSSMNSNKMYKSIDGCKDCANSMCKKYEPTFSGYYTTLSSILLFVIPLSIYFLLASRSYAEYVPKVLLYIILGGGIFFPMLKIMWIGSYMSQNDMGVRLIDEILDKEEIEEPISAKSPNDASVELKNIHFAYDTKEIISDISLKIEANSLVAFVGPSGAGKSTLAMLVARFWDISKGDILIGGESIKSIKYSELMDNISFVFQENTLFFDTIEENIRMGNRKATKEDVIAAAKIAHCHEFIEKLDDRYNTFVGEQGTYLSGGEQQRIAIARAVLKDSPIILLDEATAYADPENEGKILESFSHLCKGKTVIVIAHRLNTIMNADNIVFVDKGEILEQGKHKDLLKLDNRYAQMWKAYTKSKKWMINKKEEKSV